MNVLALDIGGANLKAAHGSLANGAVSNARAATLPFALWKQPDQLVEKLKAIAAKFPPFDALAVTMTAELCDCFEGRKSGVHHVLDAVESFAGEKRVGVWLTEGRFVTIAKARESWLACASANWHALATWVARLFPDGCSVLIDTGSTTTDITLLWNARPQPFARTDVQRLRSGELVYTGVRRTPVMALAPLEAPELVPDDPAVPIMAELFATSADVYVMLADLPEEPDNCDTADGRPLTHDAAAVRLLRMMGTDSGQFGQRVNVASVDGELSLAGSKRAINKPAHEGAMALAIGCARRQEQIIGDGVRKLLHRMSEIMRDQARLPDRVIVSGSGAFLARRAAERALPARPIETLADQIGAEASVAACAWALLHLWREQA